MVLPQDPSTEIRPKTMYARRPQAERLSDGSFLYLYSIDNVLSCQSSSCGKCGVNCSDPAASCAGCRDGPSSALSTLRYPFV